MKSSPLGPVSRRADLQRLETSIMDLTMAIQQDLGCSNRDIVAALMSAAQELAYCDKSIRGGLSVDGFDQYLIEICMRYLGRLRVAQH